MLLKSRDNLKIADLRGRKALVERAIRSLENLQRLRGGRTRDANSGSRSRH